MQKKKCKIKRVGALKGGWRMDWKKKCKIKRVGALRGRLQKKCKIKRVGALRQVERDCKTKCKIGVGTLRGSWRVDCTKICEIKRVGALRGRLRKKVQN